MSGAAALSVVTVGGEADSVATTYRSLAAQTDRRWQLCLVASADVSAELPLDPRVVRVEPTGDGWGADLAAAVESAEGAHVAVVAPGDEAAAELVAEVARVPADRWGYGDEAQHFPSGRAPQVWEKPDHSPELLRSQPYAVRTAFLPRRLVGDGGGIRPGAGSAAWYDAVLRVAESTPAPHHVRRVLWERYGPVRSRFVDGDPREHADVVRQHCERSGVEVVEVVPIEVQGTVVGQHVRRRRTATPSVSVVIPTRGSSSEVQGRERCHVVELVRSLWTDGRYPDLELVVVYDTVTPEHVLEELRSLVPGSGLVLQPYDGWFHFSRKCNLGAVVGHGDLLCFLNDDVEVGETEWLAEMVDHLSDPQVGAVGARLLFPDGTLQHIGHHYVKGDAGHPLFGWRASTLALGAAAHVAGERAGVTAACVLVRRSDFEAVGGFSEIFPLNYNDVDLCLKIRERGLRIVYTPHAELVHFESQTRVPRLLVSERDQLRNRWPRRLDDDPHLRMSHPLLPRQTLSNGHTDVLATDPLAVQTGEHDTITTTEDAP